MKYSSRLVAWFWRAWPVIMLIAVAGVHVAALMVFCEHKTFVNKLTGTFLQVGGGVIVLLSLDGNLGLFKKQSLLTALMLWMRDFPRSRDVTVSLGGVGMAGEVGMAGALTARKPPAVTIEERLSEIERKLAEESGRLRALEQATQQGLKAMKSELSQAIASVDSGLRELAGKVEVAAIGGLKQQLFGVLLAIYGAGVSVFA